MALSHRRNRDRLRGVAAALGAALFQEAIDLAAVLNAFAAVPGGELSDC
jgi:hypothetical protein